MEREQKIITVKPREIHNEDEAFAEFMTFSEECFNEHSKKEPSLYKNQSAFQLEKTTCEILKEVCHRTPFKPEDIQLISGAKFPDIVAARHYGVEVKSTIHNQWTSTGSSIVESTRIEDVNKIYLMFCNMGSNPPAFRCKPYGDCLSGIAITHSPRYLIDMCLEDVDTIHHKMGTDYDDFCQLDEKNKFSRVRSYYKKNILPGKAEVPWWLGDDFDSQIHNINLAIFSDQDLEIKSEINMRAFILFPSLFKGDTRTRYKELALWICNRYGYICHNVRDSFTAGGMVYNINGTPLERPYPKIIEKLINCKDRIKRLLRDPDDSILSDIEEYWEEKYRMKDNLYESWIDMIEDAIDDNPRMDYVNIRRFL